MSWFIDKPEPYFEDEIRDQQCVRCGEMANFQWQICSDGNNYRCICLQCDVGLNKLVLEFMKHPNAAELSAEYRRQKEEYFGVKLKD